MRQMLNQSLTILLLPLSATKINPSLSTATPYGRFNPISVTSWIHCPSGVKMETLLASRDATTICPSFVAAIPWGFSTMLLPNRPTNCPFC